MIYQHREITKTLKDNELDLSTYQLYYNQNRIKEIVDKIIKIFNLIFSIDLVSLKNILVDYNEFEIITALRKIIIDSIHYYKYVWFSFLLKRR